MIAFLLLALASPAVEVSLDRKEAALGDRVVATYTARVPKGSRLVLETLVSPARPEDAPEGSGPVLEFEAPPAPSVTEEGGELLVTQRVPFAPFVPGEVSLPGPAFALVAPDGTKTPLAAPAAVLSVSSRIPTDQPKEELAPRPGRPVRIPPVSPWWYAGAGIAAALVTGLVLLWLRRRKRGGLAAAPAEPAIAPGAELLVALERLSKGADALGTDPRGFYSDLTHAVKRYLERRLELPILEWTTFETIRRLREAGLEPPREAGLPELLSAADHVKFGKGAATRDTAREHLSRARLLHDGLEAELARRAHEERAKRDAGGGTPEAAPASAPHARAAESARPPAPPRREARS